MVKKMGETITTRVDDEMAKDIEFFSKLQKLDKSSITRRLLARSLEEEKLDYVLGQYKDGKMTIGKAAELMKKDIREMMMIASKMYIPFQYSLKELREDFEAAKKGK